MDLNPGNDSAFRDTFRRYADWNRRDGAELFVDQTRKLAVELYTQTAAIAPSKATIAQKVKSLGWRVIKRGDPDQWRQSAAKNYNKRRGRPTNATQAARKALLSAKATLEQMQSFVIKKRSDARLYLASGWLGAVVDLGGSLKSTSGEVDRERGGAHVRRSSTGVEITLWNRTDGIETMDAKKHFVAKAIAVRTADMWTYIIRKMNEQMNGRGRRAA